MRPWLRSTLAGLVCGVWATDARADAFAQGDPVDEIGLARVAEEAGDHALQAHLANVQARLRALIAVRASRYARAPEALVPGLAQLACGRDPVLAPEAAQTLLAIAERLSPAALAAREVLRSELESARQALACAERERSTRPDIVLALAELAATLDALLR